LKELRNIPGVDTLLNIPEIKDLASQTSHDFTKYVIRKTLLEIKDNVIAGAAVPNQEQITSRILSTADRIKSKNLKKVINATGIIIHTNLGRAPFSREVITEALQRIEGYNNLEFDLENASRGSRYNHAVELLKYLCGAEDILVVNNNAAAVVLILRTFARDKEVIVSRGELIEIGGSFRLPDIIATSDCKMVEVGTTNKTKITDYDKAITPDTAVLFKAHQSNYFIKGFTDEVKLSELVSLGKQRRIPVVYDLGSGSWPEVSPDMENEPNVSQTIKTGVDLVCFSGDKLLGGPQCGIIAGKKKHIRLLKKEPLLRALRVDKITLSFLETNCSLFLDSSKLFKHNLLYKTIHQSSEIIKSKAVKLQQLLKKEGINTEIVPSKAKFGGGALPDKEISSFSLKLLLDRKSGRERSGIAENIYQGCLRQDNPVLGILKKGNLYFDLLTVQDQELVAASNTVDAAYKQNVHQ
jgi:L-seryl-tRNA(Ser) seleniumtransferase